MIAKMVNMDKETVRQILHDQVNMRKVCAKMVPKNLTQEQKRNRKNICSDIMERITETKRQSMHWKTPTSPRMKKQE
jgi:hypothetical protein